MKANKMKIGTLERAAEIGKQFSDATRLGILKILEDAGKMGADVSALCTRLNVRQPTMSHHLGLLRVGKLVTATRKGKSVIYTLSDDVKRAEAVKAILASLPRAAW